MTCAAKISDINFSRENGGIDREDSPITKISGKPSNDIPTDLRAASDLARFSTLISLQAQLEALMNDQEFSKPSLSPRCKNYSFLYY